MSSELISQAVRMIQEANSTVFFGGAGVSTESGVPDFRSKNGIYAKHLGAESILTPGFMQREPEEFWSFYREYFMMKGLKPNPCHTALAAMEKEGLISAVVTQNVDGLHQKAGSKAVIELHGSGIHFYCTRCGKAYSFEEVDAMDKVPRCTKDGAQIRPDIVLYNEGLDMNAIGTAVSYLRGADLIIIGGTSMTVYPAAGLVRYRSPQCRLILMNMSETYADSEADLLIREPIGQAFTGIMELLSAEPAGPKTEPADSLS